MDRAGLEYWLHQVGIAPTRPPELPQEPAGERAIASDLDRVYRVVLRSLGLSEGHREALLKRGLDPEAIDRGMYRTLPKRGRAELAREVLRQFPGDLLVAVPGFHLREEGSNSYLSFGGSPGLVVPVRDLEGRIIALKVRRDGEEEGPKYLYISSAPHGGPGPGAPVHVPVWEGPTEEIRLTEGELKADVATRLSRVLSVSVPGVSAWRGALAVLSAIAPKRIRLAFDADAATNPQVARAAAETAGVLADEGYEVVSESWDGEVAKGIDDALAAGTPVNVAPVEVNTGPRPAPALPVPGSPYRSTPAGLVWQRVTQNGPVLVPLTNFTARIATDVLDDDGLEVRRRFEVEARLNGWCRRFMVPAESFAAMAWATEHLGARAIVFPGMGLRDHARAAVQVLSGEVPERHVYSHSGWRELSEGWAYLHGGGAVGAEGALPGVEVALPEALARLVLPNPPDGAELIAAIKASLRVADVAPGHITLPLLGAVYRAVLGEIDFALHVAGPTGAGKSELAALAQRHFGPDLDARHLPGSWSSTGNALEVLAFSAKDALLVVDDFAPASNQSDIERAHREADRVLRAQGNRSGRLRLRADGTLRAARPPRGLIVSTGEDVPRGQSIRARLLACELGPEDLDWHRVSQCQKEAGEGLYAQALSGFLRWVAGRYREVQDLRREWLPELREAAAESADHRRTPEIAANLAVGWRLFLWFAESAGALSSDERERMWGRVWTGLGRAVTAQSYHQRGGEPAQRFVELLRSALASGRAHLAGPDGGKPDVDGGAWGWRRNQRDEWEPKGERVGWLVPGDHVYLDSDAAYAAAQKLGQEVGDRLAITPQTLRRRLNEGGVLVSTDASRQVLTVRRSLEGQRRDVLHLSKRTLSPMGTPPDDLNEAR